MTFNNNDRLKSSWRICPARLSHKIKIREGQSTRKFSTRAGTGRFPAKIPPVLPLFRFGHLVYEKIRSEQVADDRGRMRFIRQPVHLVFERSRCNDRWARIFFVSPRVDISAWSCKLVVDLDGKVANVPRINDHCQKHLLFTLIAGDSLTDAVLHSFFSISRNYQKHFSCTFDAVRSSTNMVGNWLFRIILFSEFVRLAVFGISIIFAVLATISRFATCLVACYVERNAIHLARCCRERVGREASRCASPRVATVRINGSWRGKGKITSYRRATVALYFSLSLSCWPETQCTRSCSCSMRGKSIHAVGPRAFNALGKNRRSTNVLIHSTP